MDLSEVFKNYALQREWQYKYARRDYQNLIDASQFVADTIEGFGVGESAMIVDPIKRLGLSDGIRYTGNFMVLTKSDLDDDYQSRVDKYIKPLIELLLKSFRKDLECSYDVETWGSTEVINMFDWNADGLLINFSLRSYD